MWFDADKDKVVVLVDHWKYDWSTRIAYLQYPCTCAFHRFYTPLAFIGIYRDHE